MVSDSSYKDTRISNSPPWVLRVPRTRYLLLAPLYFTTSHCSATSLLRVQPTQNA